MCFIFSKFLSNLIGYPRLNFTMKTAAFLSILFFFPLQVLLKRELNFTAGGDKFTSTSGAADSHSF